MTSVVGVVASTPIDEFLAGAGRSSASGARLETLGVGLGLVGTVVVLGLLVLLAAVHVGPRSEVRTLLVIAMAGGAVMLFGGAVEIAGTAEVLGIGWTDALTDASASSAMLRLLGGLLVVLGLGDETVAADPGDDASAAHRWVPGATSAFGLVGVALGALSFAFDGHTVSQGPRLLHAGVNLVHVVAGGVWVGGVVGLAVLAARRGRGGSITPLLAPFSRIATIALGAVFVAGVAMAAIILEGPGDITGTEWGRRLVVKTAAVGVAALLGAYHHVVVTPRSIAGDTTADRSIRRTIVLEATVLTFAVVMSALLARASIA